ncbi:MAG: HicB family toxin-antitoxin system [Jatrophihabitans sp.]
MNTYRIDVTRDGRFWLIHVPAINRWTQARNLRELDAMARDLIAIMEDVPADSFSTDVHLVLPESVQRRIDHTSELRRQEAAARSEAALEARAVAKELADTGMPLRDVGEVLGVSYQRAHQLVSS